MKSSNNRTLHNYNSTPTSHTSKTNPTELTPTLTQKRGFLHRVIVAATATALAVSFSTLATAQTEDRSAIFAAAPKETTNIAGVSVFTGPPKGFDPLTATNRELLSYGLPQRPDEAANPKAFEHWKRGMLALKTRISSKVEAKPFSSRELVPAGQAAQAAIDGTTSIGSSNWSGIANTNKLKTWNNKTSFDYVESVWNVPVAQPPFGVSPCSSSTTWYEASWNGIDGFSNGDVVQGGSLDLVNCGGPQYYGWVEWFPSYPILVVYCGGSPCPVGPGDDFWVITYGAPGVSTQNVFIEDITQQWGGTLALSYVSGPGLVGSSAEYIVEAPCCSSSGGPLPLVNYVYDFFDYSFDYDVAGTLSYPGSAAASTYIITMFSGATPISAPYFYGTAGNQGRYSIWFADENCAEFGGC
jgi:hypothetical protein